MEWFDLHVLAPLRPLSRGWFSGDEDLAALLLFLAVPSAVGLVFLSRWVRRNFNVVRYASHYDPKKDEHDQFTSSESSDVDDDVTMSLEEVISATQSLAAEEASPHAAPRRRRTEAASQG